MRLSELADTRALLRGGAARGCPRALLDVQIAPHDAWCSVERAVLPADTRRLFHTCCEAHLLLPQRSSSSRASLSDLAFARRRGATADCVHCHDSAVLAALPHAPKRGVGPRTRLAVG